MGSCLWMCFTQEHVWERLVSEIVRYGAGGGRWRGGGQHTSSWSTSHPIVEEAEAQRGSSKVGARRADL